MDDRDNGKAREETFCHTAEGGQHAIAEEEDIVPPGGEENAAEGERVEQGEEALSSTVGNEGYRGEFGEGSREGSVLVFDTAESGRKGSGNKENAHRESEITESVSGNVQVEATSGTYFSSRSTRDLRWCGDLS
jgi:hypothetical protein